MRSHFCRSPPCMGRCCGWGLRHSGALGVIQRIWDGSQPWIILWSSGWVCWRAGSHSASCRALYSSAICRHHCAVARVLHNKVMFQRNPKLPSLAYKLPMVIPQLVKEAKWGE